MSTSSSSGGISILGLLGVVFVTLKLVGVISWSWCWCWWYVTLPFWGGLALVAVICLFVFFGAFTVAFIDEARMARKRRVK